MNRTLTDPLFLFRLLYPDAEKPRGWCWLQLVEGRDDGYGIRCAFLHAVLFLYLITGLPSVFFVLFCFVLFCFVLFCFVLFCFVLFCFVLFCFVLFCFVLFCFVLFCFVLFCFVLVFYFFDMNRYTMRPDAEFVAGKILYPSTQPSVSLSGLDLLYLAQLSTIYTPSNIDNSTNEYTISEENSTSNGIATNDEQNKMTTKRKHGSTINSSHKRTRRLSECSKSSKSSKFEAEMANLEGFRFGQTRAFVRDLQTIYTTLFGMEMKMAEDDQEWAWMMETMTFIFCSSELWKTEYYDILVTFVEKVILYFKQDRDMLRNVIKLYIRSSTCYL